MKTDILILGAGIGGYEAFRTLCAQLKRYDIQKKITLIDKENYFTFVPLLHEVATGSVLPSHASLPLRELLVGESNHEFVRAEVLSVSPEKKSVSTSIGEFQYEYCVLALGSTVNFFGTPGAKLHSRHVRTLRAAAELHNELFTLFETQAKSSIVIVGGGYTGVELAGQLADVKRKEIAKLYPNHELTITLVQAGREIIPNLPVKARRIAEQRLRRFGVKLMTDTKVMRVDEKAVALEDGTTLPSDITIWSAGFENVATCYLTEDMCERGRVPVNAFLQHEHHPDLYAIGDIALFRNTNQELPIPQLGEVAHLEGEYAALHLVSQIQRRKINPFGFDQHVSLMPIGDWFGLLILWNRHVISGRFAWWLRRTAYVLFMPGIIRKLRIVIDWTLQGFGYRYTIPLEEVNGKKQKT